MVGRMMSAVTKKPSRSDEVLDDDQQMRIADRIRTHFESMAPKRPAKPSRSESDPFDAASLPNVDASSIPEFQKFQSLLQSQSQAILTESGGGDVEEEFTETEYYKELDSIDKQHHTTGSGFIRVVKEVGENGHDLHFQRGSNEDEGGRGIGFSHFRSNPATNDWIPSTDEEQVLHVSSKPNRSDGC